MQFAKNALIASVLRPGSRVRDRFGAARFLIAYQDLAVRLERSRRMTRSNTGDFLALDATVILEPEYPLEPGDTLRFAAPVDESYNVLTVSEELTALGVPFLRRYGLVRAATPIPALTTSTSTTTTTTTSTTTTTTTSTTTTPAP